MKKLKLLLIVLCAFMLYGCSGGGSKASESIEKGWQVILARNTNYESCNYIYFKDLASLHGIYENNVYDGNIYYEVIMPSEDEYDEVYYFVYNVKTKQLEVSYENDYYFADNLAYGTSEPMVYKGTLTNNK